MTGQNGSKRTFTFVFGYLILAMWAVSFVVDVVRSDYEPPAVLALLLPVVAAWLFSGGVFPRGGGRPE